MSGPAPSNPAGPAGPDDAARVADLHAIATLQRQFAELNDGARWHEAAALFLEDACFTRPTDPQRPIFGRDAILQSFLSRPAGPARRHLVTQPEVQFSSDGGSARARCHSLLLVDAGEGSGMLSVGGFVDELRRTPGGWRFASRTGFAFVGPAACALPAAGLSAALDAWPAWNVEIKPYEK